MAGNKSENLTTLAVSCSSNEYRLFAQQLRKLTASLTPQDQEATLSTLRRIFDNIIQYPNDDNYRQIKLTSTTFSSKVWQYPAGEELMKMSGWVVEGDHVRLRDDSRIQIVSQLLKQDLKDTQSASHSVDTISGNRHRIDDHQSASTDHSNLPKCCALTEDIAYKIMEAIACGDGILLKKLLEPYHNSCVKSMQVGESVSITAFVFMARQIGIARILVNEYGVDANITDEDGSPSFLTLFDVCDSTEPCQSLIIQFIKEFKINVHKHTYVTALHLAVLHKLFSIIKFLVEDCKVDTNCISNFTDGGTPLHMAYGIGVNNIAQYLIEHGANLEVMDNSGRKPKDYEFYESSCYANASKFLIKKRAIHKTIISPESRYYIELCAQGISGIEAVDRTLEKFPSLQKGIDGSLVNQKSLEATPTLNELNRYITDMAPSYYDIGLQLDIVNSQLKLIKNDPNLSNLREKCRKMLEVWLENDTSATWKKLCDALEEKGLSVLAEQIKKTLR